MFDRPDIARDGIAYIYDGTFEGLLCCVYESVYEKERPITIAAEGAEQQLSLAGVKHIETDLERAARVAKSVPEKISPEASWLVSRGFLTCLPDKELVILDFLRKGYKYGKRVTDMLTDDTVHTLTKAVRRLGNESHLLTGFIRFAVYDGIMVSVIKPKNFVLPVIKNHFCGRYKQESFMIYDSAHGSALVYKPYEGAIVPVNELALNEPDEEELHYQQLWKKYYATIAIEGRYNPKCRMSHMPKRYWDYMTEFDSPAIRKMRRVKEVKTDGKHEAIEDNHT